MSATTILPSPTKVVFPVLPSLLSPSTVKQICIYQVIIKSDHHFSWQESNEDIQVLEATFDHIIDHKELNHWLAPWLEMGYYLVNVMPWQWKVQNPATSEYETVWVRSQ